MSTADKLTTVAEDVPKVYHAGQMTVVENAECLKGSKTGTAILLDDVSPVEHTMGVKVHGKNLFDENQITACAVSATGKASANYGTVNDEYLSSKFGIYGRGTHWIGFKAYLVKDKTYTLSVDAYVATNDGNLKNVCIGFAKIDESDIATVVLNNYITLSANDTWERISKQFSITESGYYCLRAQAVGNATQYKDMDVRFRNIQLELGTKATDYEPYNSDIQNVHSKNLIPYPYAETTKTVNGVTFTDNGNGTITVNGTTPSDSGASFMLSNIDIPIKAGIYTTSGCVSGSNSSGDNIMIMIVAQDDDYNMYDLSDTGSNKTTTIVNDSHIINLSIQIPPNITLNNAVFKPQLEYGKTATAYAKYHEPYPLVVSRYGKNLFSLTNRIWANFGDKDPTTVRNISKDNFYFKISANNYAVNLTTNYEIIDGNSIKITTTNAYGLGVPFHLIAGQQYTISCIKSDDIKCRINIGYYDIEGNYLSGKFEASTFTMPENAYWAILCFVGFISSGTAEELTFSNIQLELGSTATDYEPYNSKTDYTPNADGTVDDVERLYPSTTLLTNDPYGKVYIDCDYYKDIDKTFNELTTSVALSGGE